MSETYFITACTHRKRAILQSERHANLLIELMFGYRDRDYFSLHEFIVMPDHLHALISPNQTIERAMSVLKGGFSFQVKKRFGFAAEVWQQSYYDRRIREAGDYEAMRQYLLMNPVRRGLCRTLDLFPFSSIQCGERLDEPPQRLKPLIL